ncbi:GNAT family N-acetyltransferase [Rhodoferax sp.]|uniref:GNAT family N-acetyltransferase n=1 Tax=Rhodoferax sp. TaxID=50421 RepID=UPI002845933C|nr:GNAT family N-acetyltransferase [Rhodoferax sp.]MDR3372055.1 GNAT family N-acetyltransferase [Rhodoferax sp.]
MKNSSDIVISLADAHEHPQVGIFVCALLRELFPEQAHNFAEATYVAAAVELLGDATKVWAMLAKREDRPVGVIVLNECAAIYAGGVFGEISELYVLPEFRSKDIGAMLLTAADKFAVEKGWSVLEVGAPGLPRWQSTVDFYLNNGFSVIGPRMERNTGRE